MTSTHTAEPNIPALAALPAAARIAHIFPQMGNISLLSMGQLCDNGCKAIFERNRITVYFEDKIVMTGTRSRETNYLWYIDDDHPAEPMHHAMQAINQSAKAADLVEFAHASFFSPTIATLKTALHKNYITNFPGLTMQSLKRHAPNSPATAKGHLNKVRKNKRSTKKKLIREAEKAANEAAKAAPEQDKHLFPTPDEEETHQCFVTIEDTTSKAYSDQTGRFPIPSSSGNTQVFVLYHYDGNRIFMEAMKGKSKESMLAAYTKVYKRIQEAGL
jgi:hypothetical protein